MRHDTTITTWLEDEVGDQREYKLEITVNVYDIEDGDVQFRSIDAAQDARTGEKIPVSELPTEAIEVVEFEISEHKYEIAEETREPEPDYHSDPRFEDRHR